MADTRELEERFWKTLGDDRVVMLGAPGIPPRPMTAMAEEGRAPLWFFTSSDTDLGQAVDAGRDLQASASLVGKDQALFASITGRLVPDRDPAVIDRLWNPFVSAWFEGKHDPKLRLLRMDAADAQVWLNEHPMLAGAKLLLGADPERSFRDDTGNIDLH